MGNNFLWTFMMYMAMNNNKNPIPFSTVLGSLDMVPAPMRFAVQANAIQSVEQSCLTDDDNLRQSVKQMISDHGITDVSKYPAVASFVGTASNGAPATGAAVLPASAKSSSHKSP